MYNLLYINYAQLCFDVYVKSKIINCNFKKINAKQYICILLAPITVIDYNIKIIRRQNLWCTFFGSLFRTLPMKYNRIELFQYNLLKYISFLDAESTNL